MKNTNYEHLYSVENTELAQAAKKCVRIFFLMDIHPEFIISDTKLQARLACKEALALLKAYKIALNEIKKKLTISKREMSFFFILY